MGFDDENGLANGDNPPLRDVLYKLLEAQTDQAGLMRELVKITGSLARSESRESITDLANALKDLGSSNGRTSSAPPAPQPDEASGDKLVVLAQYDEMRAGLGRNGAASFYVAATPFEEDRRLVIKGAALAKATRLTIGDLSIPCQPGSTDSLVIENAPDSVFSPPPPAIRLWSGDRLIAVARYVAERSPSLLD